jgi:multimeric flavodoxin WrbA
LTVFASPIYVEDVNGAMKNFIDRMAYNCHRPRFFGRSERGWLDAGRAFYVDGTVGAPKAYAARALGKLVSAFVLK